MFTIVVRYSKDGIVAMNLKAEIITLARAKASHMKSQAFNVEIENETGKIFLLESEE